MTAAPDNTILDEAKGLIYGDRQDQYGPAHISFDNIASGWSTIVGAPVTGEQVCLMMAWLKTCRLLNQPGHHDSVVDGAGYFGCYEKVQQARSVEATVSAMRNGTLSAGKTELAPGAYTGPIFGSKDGIDGNA